MPKCVDCKYNVPNKTNFEREKDTGVCRRYPPAVFPHPGSGISMCEIVVRDNNWCGEFKPKEKK